MKRILSLILALLVVMTGFSGIVFAEDSIEWTVVTTEADFLTAVTGSATGTALTTTSSAPAYIKLDADLTFGEGTASGVTTAFSQLTGTFYGQIDGQGHKITIYANAALFGAIESASISNLNMYGYIKGTAAYSATLATYMNKNTVLTNVNNYATINYPSNSVGGIVGASTAGFSGMTKENYAFINCKNYGDITGGKGTGGLTSYNTAYMENCANFGEIYSQYGPYAGGLAGGIRNGFLGASGCYNTGDVNARMDSAIHTGGGLFGGSDSSAAIANAVVIENCYNTGKINQKNNQHTGVNGAGIIGGIKTAPTGSITVRNCYNVGTSTNPIATSNVTTQDCYYLSTEADSDTTDGVTPVATLAAMKTAGATFISTVTASAGLNGSVTPAETVGYINGTDATYTVTADANYYISSVKVNGEEQVDAADELTEKVITIEDIDEDVTIVAAFAKVTVTFEDGSYIDDDGYRVVSTKAQFINALTGSTDGAGTALSTDAVKIKLASDIDLGEGTKGTSIETSSVTSSYIPFTGIFKGELDGDGKKITIYSDNVEGNYGYGSLFRETKNAYIHDLDIDGFVNTKKDYAAALIRSMGAGTTLDNVTNYAYVKGVNTTGGLVAYATVDEDKATYYIKNCVNEGIVDGVMRIGGIVGNGAAYVENCANYGYVKAAGGLGGGIVGDMHWYSKGISNCFNAGPIDAKARTADGVAYPTGGGITGGARYALDSDVKIENCYNTAVLNLGYPTEEGIAGIAGAILAENDAAKARTGELIIENCYNVGTLKNSTNYIHPANHNNNVTTATNCYYLSMAEDTDNNSGTTAKTLAEMRTLASALGSAFKAGDADYMFPQLVSNKNTSGFAIYSVTATAGENGTIAPAGEQYVVAGSTADFTIASAEGYRIATLTNNGADITTEVGNTEAEISPVITVDTVIAVSFEKIPAVSEEDLAVGPVVKEAAVTEEADTFKNQDGDFTLEAGVAYVTGIAKVQQFKGWEVVEYGIKLNGTKYDAKIPYTSDGSFGILFYGNAITEDGDYELVPYVIYKNLETEETCEVSAEI